MAEDNGSITGFAPDGRFAKGNKLGRGNPIVRASQMFRVQVVRELKAKRSIPRLIQRLQHLANGSVPIYQKGEDGKRRRVWLDVDPAVQLNAIKELLNRALGKSTDYKVIEDASSATKVGNDLARLVTALRALGTPKEMWPPAAVEYERKQVAVTVVATAKPDEEKKQ